MPIWVRTIKLTVAHRSYCDGVVLQIDTSAPFLRPSQLAALVRAVRDAADHDEHRWIEWKSQLDLTTAAGQGHIAKALIGLANRHPAAAALQAGRLLRFQAKIADTIIGPALAEAGAPAPPNVLRVTRQTVSQPAA